MGVIIVFLLCPVINAVNVKAKKASYELGMACVQTPNCEFAVQVYNAGDV